jgi:hypothetical protein
MDLKTIVVLALAVVVMGIIGGLVLYANKPEGKKGRDEQGR